MIDNENRAYWLGFALAILAALFFSSKTIFIKLAYQHSVDPITLLCLRMLFSFPFFLLVAIYQAKKKDAVLIKKNHYLSIIALGIVGYYLASLFDFLGLQYIPASIGRLILFLYPTLTVIIAVLLMNHPIKTKEIIALVLSYFGIALVCLNDSDASSDYFFLGSFLVFLSALCFAIYLTGGVNHIKRIGSNRYTAIAMSISSIAVVIHFLIARDLSNLSQTIEVYLYSFAIAIFSTVLPVFLMSAAIHQLGVVKTSMIGSFAPIGTIVLGAIFLAEKMSFIQLFGVFIIFMGIFQLKTKTKAIEEVPVGSKNIK